MKLSPAFSTWFLGLFLALFPCFLFAQHADFIWKPKISYSWSSSERLAISANLEMFNSLSDLDNIAAISYIEPQFTFSYAFAEQTKAGGGYYYRHSTPFVDGYQYEHRLLEQISFTYALGGHSLKHRARLEQRIRSSSYQNRLRYRVQTKLPFRKQQAGSAESYLSLSEELMTAFNKYAADAENRFYVGLGWLLKNNQKLELGVEYRMQDIASGDPLRHLILLNTSYHLGR
jgi:hypothetical protein